MLCKEALVMLCLAANGCPDEQLSGLAFAFSLLQTPFCYIMFLLGALNIYLTFWKTKQNRETMDLSNLEVSPKQKGLEEDIVFSLCCLIMPPCLGTFLTSSIRVYCVCWPLSGGGSSKRMLIVCSLSLHWWILLPSTVGRRRRNNKY